MERFSTSLLGQASTLLIVGNAINSIDSSGGEMLHHLVVQLRESGVELVCSGLKKQILDVIRATGLHGLIGDQNIFATEDQALRAIYGRLGEVAEEEAQFFTPWPTGIAPSHSGGKE